MIRAILTCIYRLSTQLSRGMRPEKASLTYVDVVLQYQDTAVVLSKGIFPAMQYQ